MDYYKFEYLWLDGYKPVANIRSKTKAMPLESFDGDVSKLPNWSFDGSSTRQAEGHFSDLTLVPKRLYPDPGRENAYLVICEVHTPDGKPHPTNTRATIDESKSEDFWIGFEQEYTLFKRNVPLGIG